jgi:hypothetical protein
LPAHFSHLIDAKVTENLPDVTDGDSEKKYLLLRTNNRTAQVIHLRGIWLQEEKAVQPLCADPHEIVITKQNGVKTITTFDGKLGVSIPPSQERVALMMLYLENPNLITKNIIEGLKKGDRLKVYNEIKYNLNSENDPQIQRKRDEIADLFGKENPN